MFKIKNIVQLLVVFALVYACGDDNFGNNPFADIDHKALALKDNDSIVKFLENHYYDFDVDSVKPLETGKTSIYEDKDNLKIMNVTENDIDYKLYVYVVREGDYGADRDKGFPTKFDSVFVKYTGKTFTGTTFSDTNFDQNNSGTWQSLTSVIRGWSHGFTKFKGGELKKGPNGGAFNGPITFLNGGKGVLFIPSGLAYPSSVLTNIQRVPQLVNLNLMFYIDLLTIVDKTDHDNDSVPTYLEDLNDNGNASDDDTDSDGVPNFFDTDDDGDGVLTKDEDRNGNGDPTDDFNDPDNPTLPDYLNPNIKG